MSRWACSKAFYTGARADEPSRRLCSCTSDKRFRFRRPPSECHRSAGLPSDFAERAFNVVREFDGRAKDIGGRSRRLGVGDGVESPKEYGPHWDGFSKRYGMRLTAVATGNAIEASLGTLWGEDPRYFPSTERRSLTRLRHAAVMVFMARRDNGHNAPAFARYAGIVGNNIISNTWRVPSETGVSDALTRSALELAGKFAANFFDEFWPDINRKLRKRR